MVSDEPLVIPLEVRALTRKYNGTQILGRYIINVSTNLWLVAAIFTQSKTINMKEQYSSMPRNDKEAKDRAMEFQAWLLEKTGVKWAIRVHENCGWFYSLSYGTLKLSQYSKNYGNGGFLLMNGAVNSGCGHIELSVLHPKSLDEILPAIKQSLSEQVDFVAKYADGLKKNEKLRYL